MPISANEARNASPNADGSPRILRDGDGLDLWITRSRKVWRCKVQRGGKRTTLNLGYFPEMSVTAARAARMAVRMGDDPARERRTVKAAIVDANTNTFRTVAARWHSLTAIEADWTPRVADAVQQRLAKHVLPAWGNRSIGEIDTRDVETLLDGVRQSARATAVEVKNYIIRIFDYAAAHDPKLINPASRIARYLPKRRGKNERRQPYVRTIEDARKVLRAIERRAGTGYISPSMLLAHRLIALTAVRKAEAFGATWAEFDLDSAEWTIPAARMKMREDHVVALSPQAIEVVEAANRLRRNEFVFPSPQGGGQLNRSSINEVMAINLRAARLGPIMVPHGWRSTFSTIMNEVNPDAFRVIDVMLAHRAFRDSVDGAERRSSVEGRYNHARHLSARHRIAAQWADMLLDGAPSAFALIGLVNARDDNVVPMRKVVPARRAAA